MDIPEALRADAEELSRITGYMVEIVSEGARVFVVVKQASLPFGTYTRAVSDVLLIADFQYPMSAMDMFYMEPGVEPARMPLPGHASSIEEYAGRRWRRWSWHRNGIWKPGVDNLLSHWAFVEACWAKESAA